MVTASVARFWTLGASVSAPWLNPSKKLRSSRQHISSPEPPSDDDEMATNEPPPDASGVDIDVDIDIDIDADPDLDENEPAVLRAIGRSQRGIWSGRHHGVVGLDDSESEEGRSDEDEGDGRETEDEGYDDWDEDLENPSGLSALDQLGEDFERNAAANGESLSFKIAVQHNS